jgi:hypothetical protein
MDIADGDFGFKMNCTEFYKFISIVPKLIVWWTNTKEV